MNLQNMIPFINSKHDHRDTFISSLNKSETYKGIFYENLDLYGDIDYNYYVLIISLFDRAIIDDDMFTLSKEQVKLLEQYFAEANPLVPDETVNIDEHIYDFSTLSKHIDRLDEFLGSYLGENNGEYSRYGKKQLHCKCKSFGTKANPFIRD